MKEPKLHLVMLNIDVLSTKMYEYDKPMAFFGNVTNNMFTGYLVNNSSTTLYFEPEDHEGLILIPHAWVKWCIPINKKEGL